MIGSSVFGLFQAFCNHDSFAKLVLLVFPVLRKVEKNYKIL